ncbi:MAG: hypothetical protein QOI83_1229, partial [Streptomycetaceae bacterium]|nr:hypothetical protein [Streptomycetaceae bacterium]
SFDEHCTPLAERLDAADTGYVPRPAEDERLRERAGIHRSGRDAAPAAPFAAVRFRLDVRDLRSGLSLLHSCKNGLTFAVGY